MFKDNSILCDVCQKIIQAPASESRVKEEELCERCQEVADFADKIMEEHRELFEALRKAGD